MDLASKYWDAKIRCYREPDQRWRRSHAAGLVLLVLSSVIQLNTFLCTGLTDYLFDVIFITCMSESVGNRKLLEMTMLLFSAGAVHIASALVGSLKFFWLFALVGEKHPSLFKASI